MIDMETGERDTYAFAMKLSSLVTEFHRTDSSLSLGEKKKNERFARKELPEKNKKNIVLQRRSNLLALLIVKSPVIFIANRKTRTRKKISTYIISWWYGNRMKDVR